MVTRRKFPSCLWPDSIFRATARRRTGSPEQYTSAKPERRFHLGGSLNLAASSPALAAGSKIGVIAFSAGFIERTYPLANWAALGGFFACVSYYVYLNLPRSQAQQPQPTDAASAAEAGVAAPLQPVPGAVADPSRGGCKGLPPTETTPLTAAVSPLPR